MAAPAPRLSNGEVPRQACPHHCRGKQRVIIDSSLPWLTARSPKSGPVLSARRGSAAGPGGAADLPLRHSRLGKAGLGFDTRTGELRQGSLWRRPKFDLEVFGSDGSYWPMFEPHHYLKLPRMVAAKYYVGFVDGEAVCHMAVRPAGSRGMRACPWWLCQSGKGRALE